MKECRIYADISGEVIKISSYIQGSVITEERQLLVISDRSQCFFESNQKMYADSFHEGDVVELVLSSGGNTIYLDVMPVNMENWDAKLSFKIVSGDASAVSVGTYGSINFVVDSRMQVLAVPKSCVHRTEGGESYVYILNSNNVREMKKVTVGLRGDDMTEIIDGLTEGEEILLQ